MTTPEQLREQAAVKIQEAHESFERCDTDGFLSQWAHGVEASRLELEARIVEAGGLWEFPALFDLHGALVPAKQIQTQYGTRWALLDPANPDGRFRGFFGPSEAATSKARKASDARRGGFFVGLVRVPARAVLRGSTAVNVRAVAERTDGCWDPDAEVVCNGQGEDLKNGLGGVYGRYYTE
ncbi:hypothetical protein BJF83_21465 [Nocardiopsis sp. CNR-923]|uniref:hypothetical protein n=1 Tax=Nocardiopsis sp. CNR-923 TaxID=1904965 RepID=UPI00095E5A10|nr:hypothetical protein [Nocardiopsis sp. CNR-923]OLT26372.1 hypothetical protein BJF83_21465 [Nocardiopsis sp. CNR-923]